MKYTNGKKNSKINRICSFRHKMVSNEKLSMFVVVLVTSENHPCTIDARNKLRSLGGRFRLHFIDDAHTLSVIPRFALSN